MTGPMLHLMVGGAPRPDTTTDAIDVLTDRSLAWLSFQRPYQQLIQTYANTYTQSLD